MLKKNCFILLFLIFTHHLTFAGFWDDIAGCVSNPCNCGGGTRNEQWGGKPRYQGDENKVCPPWNKTAGRDNGTCLTSTPYPSNFVPYYVSYCAESTTESNYFTPKIKVRSQTCNVACWSQSKTLDWDGQCVIWPGPYALPMLRICARIAVPENKVPNLDSTQPDKVFPADPGYTIGKHINSEGFEIDDKPMVLEDGTTMIIPAPKLCAYKDPSLYDIVTGALDLMDYNPNSQPIHKAQGVHPIAEVLKFFIDTATGGVSSLGTLIGQLMDSITGIVIPGVDIFKVIFDTVGDIIKYIGSAIKALLDEILQFNRQVDDFKFGCVEIPLGPFPPPYCSKLIQVMPTPTTQAICNINDTTGNPIYSSMVNKCVKSSVINNIIRNSVRISFDNFVPLCKNGENSLTTDKCVNILNFGGKSAASMHIATANRDIINKCGTSSTGLCVSTMIAAPRAGKFRIIYGLKTGSVSTPINYYVEDDGTPIDPTKLPKPIYDCEDPRAGSTCQEIWGVNVGDFIDATLTFPKVESVQNSSVELKQKYSLTDKNGINRDFNVSIVRQLVTNNGFTQLPNQICVTESSNLVGCESRPTVNKPIVNTCNKPPAGVSISCTDNFYIPKFIVTLQSGSDSTSTVAELFNAHTSIGSAPTPINLAGFEFGSFATDDSFVTQPYSGSHSFNSASIYGQYKDNKAPYDSNYTPDRSAIYLTGIEYVNNKYIQGGKYACLQIPNIEKCPTNQPMCVLTKLLNNNIVSCTQFIAKSIIHPNLRVCTITDKGCTIVDSIPKKNAQGVFNIYKCNTSDLVPSYCYGQAGDTEVCAVSKKSSDRNNPAPSLGDVLADSQFYPANQNQNTNPAQFDKDLYVLRDKTPVEFGLCTDIVQPKCAEVIAPSSAYDGWALWPQAEPGEKVTGQCLPDYILQDSSKPLERYCISNAERREVKYDQIDPTGGCVKQEVVLKFGNTDFPNDYGQKIEGDSKEGSVTFGKRADSHRVDGLGKTYYVELNFKVGHVRGLDYFRIKELTYDDYMVIKVNGILKTLVLWYGKESVYNIR